MAASNENSLIRRLLRARKTQIAVGLLMVLLVGPKTCNYVIHRPTHVDPEHAEVREELHARGRYLGERVGKLSTGEMPSFLGDQFKGEWLAVTYSMTAMALANLSFLYPDMVDEARATIDQLARAMLEKDVRSFDAELWGEDPIDSLGGANGHIGYLGHLELVLLAQLYVGGNQEHVDLTRSVAIALHRRMLESPSLHAETYPGQTFVADNAVVVACLALAQPLFPDDTLDISKAWTERARRNFLDPATGLMVFRLTREGEVLEQSRGSGVAWGIFYLSYADRAFAEQQYRKLHDTMASTALLSLVHGIREYPPGVEGTGDVDSGPVVLGLSPSGTGFALAGATIARDDEFKLELLRTAELVGTSLHTDEGTRYLLAPLVGDAILLAMRTTTSWTTRFVAKTSI